MREIRQSGSEGGAGSNTLFLPLSVNGRSATRSDKPFSELENVQTTERRRGSAASFNSFGTGSSKWLSYFFADP